MSMLKLLAAVGGSTPPTYVDDVFSAYTYTGNGSTQTITNGIDLAGEGGLVWIKERNSAVHHNLVDTVRGTGNALYSSANFAQASDATGVTGFGSTGFDLGANISYNGNADAYVSWTFRKAPKFFSQATATVTGGVDATVSFTDLATLGMVIVKRTDSTGSWYVWHRSLTAGKLLYLEQTAAEATLGHITVSGTTVTLEGGVIVDGSYIVYAWAHDTATDGVIQCGSFVGAGSTVNVDLGWEPQYMFYKAASVVSNWRVVDSSRDLSVVDSRWLNLNATTAESAYGGPYFVPRATGFTFDSASLGSGTFVYLAIRRPNKPPTLGTQVYNAIARTGTGAAATVTGVGFAPDLTFSQQRAAVQGNVWYDRLRGATNYLTPSAAGAEGINANGVTAFGMDGFSLGTEASVNGVLTLIHHFFKRAPGVFDEVCDTGTGAAHTISHNLTVIPELMIRKKRSAADAWYVYHSGNTANPETDYLILNTTAATADLDTIWNDTAPTSSVFTVGTHDDVNQSTGTFVTYLFATKAGISKCGSYTGNGTTQNIDMGFAAGARFFLVKATSTTGSWWVWDSVRGIVAGTDFGLQFNSTAAETTSADAVDPYAGGISVVEEATCAINTNAVVYVYFSVA